MTPNTVPRPQLSAIRTCPVTGPVSSRKHRETQPVIGYFLNTIVYRLDLSGNPSFRELLQRTRVITLEAMANSDLPFEVLLNKLQTDRDPSRAPLVDSSYAYGNDHRKAEAPTGMASVEEFDAFYQSGWLDVNLGVNDNTDHCVVVFDYLTDLFLRSNVFQECRSVGTVAPPAIIRGASRLC